MIWSFRTNGNYVDFIHTDETDLHEENLVHRLHNTSRCIDWSLPVDTTRISFTIDETRYENVLITDIDFDGTPMNEQADFETGIEAMFPGLAGGGEEGGSSYLVYTALASQVDTDAPTAIELANTIGEGDITFGYNNVGDYRINSASGAFTADKTFVLIGGFGGIAEIVWVNATRINLITYLDDGSTANELLTKQSIEIRVYP